MPTGLPYPPLGCHLCIPASNAGEAWRVPAKAQRPGRAARAKDRDTSQERVSSQHFKSPLCLLPHPQISS